MTTKTHNNEHRYGIGAVAKLTGLTDHTIRVWERRYSAIVAKRSANGRRVYGPQDVEKLGLLKRLTDRGLAIGQIASLTIDALHERVRSINDIAAEQLPDRVGTAVLGESLAVHFAANERDIAPVDIVIADDNRDTFVADLARHQVDAIVLESAVLDGDVTEQLLRYMELAGADRGVLVYNFGRLRDAEVARDSRIAVLRAPVDIDEVCAAVVRARAPMPMAAAKASSVADVDASNWQFSGPVAPRRFNNQQLTRLTRASTAIDCECPHHLAQLVGDLTAFEVYSAQCANRDEDDAALHRYLHQTTAQARALIEAALVRVAEAEGIEY